MCVREKHYCCCRHAGFIKLTSTLSSVYLTSPRTCTLIPPIASLSVYKWLACGTKLHGLTRHGTFILEYLLNELTVKYTESVKKEENNFFSPQILQLLLLLLLVHLFNAIVCCRTVKVYKVQHATA